jgi:hypothetical protein
MQASIVSHNPTTGQKGHTCPLSHNAICDVGRFENALKAQDALGDTCNHLDSFDVTALSDTCQSNACDDYDDELFEVGEKSHRHMTPIADNSEPKGKYQPNQQTSSTEFHLCSGQFDVRKYKTWVGEKFLHVD